MEQNLSDLDYLRKLEDEVPNTGMFMEDHGVKLIHHDEENAALEFEEQHFAYPVGGGKEIIDEYLILIAKYETADVLYDHEAAELTLDDEGRVNGVVGHTARRRPGRTKGVLDAFVQKGGSIWKSDQEGELPWKILTP